MTEKRRSIVSYKITINGRSLEIEDVKNWRRRLIGVIAEVQDESNEPYPFLAAYTIQILRSDRGYTGHRTRQEALKSVKRGWRRNPR